MFPRWTGADDTFPFRPASHPSCKSSYMQPPGLSSSLLCSHITLFPPSDRMYVCRVHAANCVVSPSPPPKRQRVFFVRSLSGMACIMLWGRETPPTPFTGRPKEYIIYINEPFERNEEKKKKKERKS